MVSYELKPQYDTRKSFYGKARVESDGVGHSRLISYSTEVATIGAGVLNIKGWYSATTTRHIKEYAYQHGFEVGSTAEMTKLYCK